MLRVVIVDDEPLARRALRRLLKPHARVVVAGEADTASAAVALVARERPDVMLLDIELEQGDGFDLLATLSPAPLVVFVTAHPQYAVEAFKVRAVDYLLKPITQERFDEALDRVWALVAGPREGGRGSRCAGAADALSHRSRLADGPVRHPGGRGFLPRAAGGPAGRHDPALPVAVRDATAQPSLFAP